MRTAITTLALLASLALTTGATAAPKQQVCHNGHTLTIAASAVPAHLRHGDTRGACSHTPQPPTSPPGTVPVTPDTFTRVSRILACADRPVLRTADNTMGIAVDLDLTTYSSGLYTGVKFVLASYYEGVGATCDPLGGTYTGKVLASYGYPIWVR